MTHFVIFICQNYPSCHLSEYFLGLLSLVRMVFRNGGCFIAGCFVTDISLNEIIESPLSFSHSFYQIINDNHPPPHEIKIPLSRAILYYFKLKMPTFSLVIYKIYSKMPTLTLLSILFSFRINSYFPTVCNSNLKYQRRNIRHSLKTILTNYSSPKNHSDK